MRRFGWQMLILGVLYGLALLTGYVYARVTGVFPQLLTQQPGPAVWLLIGACLTVEVACFAVMFRESWRLKQRLREHGYRVCLQCQYPLEREPTRSACPECGVEYHLGEVHGAWEAWHASQWGRRSAR